jgi:hypothetical protein
MYMHIAYMYVQLWVNYACIYKYCTKYVSSLSTTLHTHRSDVYTYTLHAA